MKTSFFDFVTNFLFKVMVVLNQYFLYFDFFVQLVFLNIQMLLLLVIQF
jgi:hypothetical protein